ncbi:MAG: hypothetical protein QXU18_03505 [Thermoplasmatales archaeon]
MKSRIRVYNEKYRKIVFGEEDIGTAFSKYRKSFRKEGLTKKRMMELVERGILMILTRKRHSINSLRYILMD